MVLNENPWLTVRFYDWLHATPTALLEAELRARRPVGKSEDHVFDVVDAWLARKGVTDWEAAAKIRTSLLDVAFSYLEDT